MVESRPEDPSTSCCGPYVFTSVLLGVLACVLMTGGVFLAFHRWDPLWLIVSGVGVVLVLIGSILHCCRQSRRPSSSKGGCCLPDHLHNHVVLNGGSLTEQLLPLSNARSVSQLSLNMLPGYFPPMVTAYGIEQHSAVVQNINRIIQQQTTQSSASVGSPGKSFILLSLPGNTPQANIQNLVATVYQLDGSVLTETANSAEIPSSVSSVSTVTTTPTVQSHIPILKNAEVQTCAAWPVPNSAKPTNSVLPSTSNATNERCCSPISPHTDDVAVAINLIDYLPEPICDTSGNSALNVDIPLPEVLVEVSEDRTLTIEPEVNRTPIIDNPELSINSISVPQPPSIPTSTEEPLEVLVDISETVVSASSSSNILSTVQTSPTEPTTENNLEISSNLVTASNEDSIPNITNVLPPTSTEALALGTCDIDSPVRVPDSPNSSSESIMATASASLDNLEDICQNIYSENSSLSLVDDVDSIGRSSPPPSYEDVALQRENPVGLFGIAYGTL